jgi:SagB-type dehydrogenase family enzyme
MPQLKESLGYRYLQDTKFDRRSIFRMQGLRISAVPHTKTYDGALARYPLEKAPSPLSEDYLSLLMQRRSRRSFSRRSLSRQELSALLWASQGVTESIQGILLRTAPSAGALHPLETYCVLERVEELPRGVYHLNVRDFTLELLREGSFGSEIGSAALGQTFMGEAAAVVGWSAVLRRNMAKYGHRGLRYIMMDAGHACQNLLLAAEGLGLNGCPVAAFLDDEMNRVFDLDGEQESMIYTVAVGPRG